MSEMKSPAKLLHGSTGVFLRSSISPAPDASVTPVRHSRLPEGSDNDKSTSKKSISPSPTKVQDELKVSNSSDAKLQTQRRKSTIKYQVSASSQSPPLGSRYALRPLGNRKGSTTSVQSRYSEMATDYFESIPAKYNTYAGFFTWILLAGFVLGPSAQQAATQAGLGETYRRVVRKVPLLALSIVCSGIGMSGILFLWFRWRNNYMWLIHKVFLPGALNGLAGTLAVSVNIWAIQGGKFTFNSTTIITLSITLGSTVTCLILTVIYQFALISIKKEHRRLVGQAKSDAGLEEAPTVKKTIAEHDFSDTQDSIWNVLSS